MLAVCVCMCERERERDCRVMKLHKESARPAAEVMSFSVSIKASSLPLLSPHPCFHITRR